MVNLNIIVVIIPIWGNGFKQGGYNMTTYRKPIGIRIICVILSILMVLLCLNDWSFTTKAIGDGVNGVSIVIKDASGTEIAGKDVGFTYTMAGPLRNGTPIAAGDEIKDGDVLSFTLNWSTGTYETATTGADSEFVIEFNNLLTQFADILNIDKPSTDYHGGCLAAYNLSSADGVLRITITPKDRKDNFSGYCDVDAEISVAESEIPDSGMITLMPLTEKTFTYTPGSLTTGKSTVGGLYQAGGKWYQNFCADLNVSYGKLDVSVSDTFGDAYKGVYGSMYLTNNWAERVGDQLPSAGTAVTPTVSGNSFSLQLDDLTGNNMLIYALEIDPEKIDDILASGSDTGIKNTLSATHNKVTPLYPAPADKEAKPTISAPTVAKSGVHNADDETVTWTITVDPHTLGLFGDLDLSDLTVTDTPGNNLTLDQIKAGLGSAVYTEEGGAVKIAGSNFTKNADGTYSFSYTAGYADGTAESTNPNVGNKAKAKYGAIETNETTGSVNVGDTGVVGGVGKNLAAADPDSYTLSWTVDVEVPTAAEADSITIDDNSLLVEFSPEVADNVFNAALLKTDIYGFTYTVDGSPVDITPYVTAGSVKYNQINGVYNYEESSTFNSAKDAGFKFTLGQSFIDAYAGKTLRISYDTTMGGDIGGKLPYERRGLIKYTNSTTAYYYKNTVTKGSPNSTATYYPTVTAKKVGKDFSNGGNPKIYPDYGKGGDYPALAFWEIKIKSSEDFTAGQVIKVVDTVSEGHKYYNGSARLLADSQNIDNDYSWITDVSSIPTSYQFNGDISASASANVTTFTVTVTEEMAAAAKLQNNSLKILYATTPADDSVSKAVLFGSTVSVSNNADIYLNNIIQAKDLSSTQNLEAAAPSCEKSGPEISEHTDPNMGYATYRITVNKAGADLSSGDTIIVDDWLGGSIEVPAYVTFKEYAVNEWGDLYEVPGTKVEYKTEKNTAYDDDPEKIHTFFKDEHGDIVADSAIYKTGVGKRMTLTLSDQKCYIIEYTSEFEKTGADFDEIEVAARYSNTAVVRNDDGNRKVSTKIISRSAYHADASAAAGSPTQTVTFNIRKVWQNDEVSERPDRITLHVVQKDLNDTDYVKEWDENVILDKNATVQEDGTWLFALKLDSLTADGHKYSYTITENYVEGYASELSEKLEDKTTPAGKESAIYNSTLTNTAAPKFIVDKTDITGSNELSGAKLAIYKAEDVGTDGKPLAGKTPVKSWTSDGNEKTIALADGDYVLIETGDSFHDPVTDKTYKVTPSTARFTIGADGVKNVTIDNDAGGNGKIVYTAASGSAPAKFVVSDAEAEVSNAELKVDKKSVTGDAEVNGAKIAIYNKTDIGTDGKPKSGAVAVDSWTSNGTTHTSSLGEGDYVLSETGDTFTDTVTGKKYFITDSSFSFKVISGVITDATATNPTGGKGSMTYDDTSKTLKVCDAEVPKVLISKTDMTGQTELAGAVLQLFDTDGKQIGSNYTSKVGEKWEVGPLDAGTYIVKETTAPDGYRTITTDVRFTVDSNGTVTGVTGSGKLDNGIVLVEDDLSRITFTKVDTNGNKITTSNAEFRLTISGGKTLDGVMYGSTALSGTSFTFTSNEATFVGLKDGSYTIEELTAPTGYFKTDTISFTVENGVIKPFDPTVITNSAANIDGDGNMSIFNALKGSKTISVTKIWDGDLTGDTADTDVTVELYRTGDTDTLVDSKVLNKTAGWSTVFSVEEQSGTYYVKEKTVTKTGYTVTTSYVVGTGAATSGKSADIGSAENTSVKITNRADEIPSTDAFLIVEKKWTDESGDPIAAGDIPENTIYLHLYDESGMLVRENIALEAPSWKTTINGLTNGAKYCVKENSTGDYTVTYSPSNTSDDSYSGLAAASTSARTAADITITNIRESVTISVTKQWTGDNAGIASVTAELYKVGTPDAKVGTAVLSAASSWSADFNVLKNSGEYYVKETAVTKSGFIFTTSYTVGSGLSTTDKSANIASTADAGVTITNNAAEIPDTSATIVVTKKWQNDAGQALTADEIPVTSVSVQLYTADGTAVGTPAELNSSNGWQHIFTGLVNGAKYYAVETTTGDFVTTYSPAGTTAVQSAAVAATNTAKTSPDITVTNTRESVTISVTKQWTGDLENATAGVNVTAKLFRSDGTQIDVMTLSGDNGWNAVFNVPKGSGEYYIKEDAVTKDGYTITTSYRVGTGVETSGTSENISSAGSTSAIIINNAIKDAALSTLAIIKTDMRCVPIPAGNKAKFRLTILDAGIDFSGVTVDGQVPGAVKTVDYEGNNVTFVGLPDGNYLLEEIMAPAGYTAAGAIYFMISGGSVQFDTTRVNSYASIDEHGNLLVLNERSGSVGPIKPTPTPSTPTITPSHTGSETTVTTTTQPEEEQPTEEETTAPEETEIPEETTVVEEEDNSEDTTTESEGSQDVPESDDDDDRSSSTSTETSTMTSTDTDDDNPHTGKEAGITALLASGLVTVVAARKKKNGKKEK